MEVRGRDRKEPGLGPGHLQSAGPWGEVQTPIPASLGSLKAPLNVLIDSVVTSISPRLLLLIKCPCGHARRPDVILLHSPTLLPSVGHTVVIQVSWVTIQSPGETLPECPSQGVTKLWVWVYQVLLPCPLRVAWALDSESQPASSSLGQLPLLSPQLYNLSPICKALPR